MSFADHIRACNNFDRSRVVPLLAGGLRIGWLRHDNAAALARFDSVFAVEPTQAPVRHEDFLRVARPMSAPRPTPSMPEHLYHQQQQQQQ